MIDLHMHTKYSEGTDTVQEILSKANERTHDAGGLVFLAHPYQYKFNDTEEFLNKIYNGNNFDGVECLYTNFSKEQSQYLLGFAQERNLLISGGSDYHGENKRRHDLGRGKGNLDISKDIISNWNVEFFDAI